MSLNWIFGKTSLLVVAAATLLIAGISRADSAPTKFEAEVIQKFAKQLPMPHEESDWRNDFRALKVASLPNHTLLNVSYQGDLPVFTYLYDDEALRHPERIVLELAVFATFERRFRQGLWEVKPSLDRLSAKTIHDVVEVYANAQKGSLKAQAYLAGLSAEVAGKLVIWDETRKNFPELQGAITDLINGENQKAQDLRQKAVADDKAREKAFAKWKSAGLWDELEKQPLKLNDLILNNDRAGVAKLIRSYLPWTLMENVESEFWKGWLDAMEHPDLKNRKLLYRGLDFETDKVQRRQTAKGEIYGLMSTVLTKNQGSYTRRLRSLSTNRIQNGASLGATIEAGGDFIRISQQFHNHALEPVGSSFLSLTSDPDAAVEFAAEKGGLMAISIDPRRLLPNLTSEYETEFEYLAPLIVFPDEIVAFREGAVSTTTELIEFVKEVRAAQGLSEPYDHLDPKRLPKHLLDFRVDGLEAFGKILSTPGAAGGLCSQVWK